MKRIRYVVFYDHDDAAYVVQRWVTGALVNEVRTASWTGVEKLLFYNFSTDTPRVPIPDSEYSIHARNPPPWWRTRALWFVLSGFPIGVAIGLIFALT